MFHGILWINFCGTLTCVLSLDQPPHWSPIPFLVEQDIPLTLVVGPKWNLIHYPTAAVRASHVPLHYLDQQSAMEISNSTLSYTWTDIPELVLSKQTTFHTFYLSSMYLIKMYCFYLILFFPIAGLTGNIYRYGICSICQYVQYQGCYSDIEELSSFWCDWNQHSQYFFNYMSILLIPYLSSIPSLYTVVLMRKVTLSQAKNGPFLYCCIMFKHWLQLKNCWYTFFILQTVYAYVKE